METKKISELTEVTSPTSTDVFTIVNDGETKKVQLTNVKTVLGVTQAETDIDGLDTRLTTAEGEIDTAQTDINNAEAVIGNETDTYSASSTYALGDLVIYNSLLYKCTTAITVAETWNSAKWTQIDLVNVSSGLKGKILWTNPNPEATFATQSISLGDVSSYDTIKIVWARNQILFGSITEAKIANDNYLEISMCISAPSDYYIGSRHGQMSLSGNNLSINFDTNYVYKNGTIAPTFQDKWCVPMYIIGIKTGLFN